MMQFVKKNILKFIYIIFFLFLAYFLYKTDLYKFINKLPCLCISLSIIIISFIIYLKSPHIFLYKNKIDVIIFTILTILFLLMLPITDLIKIFFIEKTLQSIFTLFYYVIVLITSFNILLIKIFYSSLNNNNNENLKLTIFIINIINLSLLLIYVLSTSTGYYDYDFKFIWNTSLLYISNWHTYAYTLLIYLSRVIFHSPYVTVIIQSALWFIALNYSLKILARETKNKKIIILFSIIQIFLLTGFKQAVFLWKDTIFTISFYIIILSIIDCVSKQNINKKNIFVFIIFGINVCNFRHGGCLLIFITVVLIMIFFKNNNIILKKILLCGIIAILSYFVLNTICTNIFKGYKKIDNVTYTVPIYQIAYFLNQNYEFGTKDIEYLKRLYPIEIWKYSFKLNDGDSVSREWRVPNQYAENLKIFDYTKMLSINLKLLIHKPFMYIKSLLDLNNILWKITDIDSITEINILHTTNQLNDNEFFFTSTKPLCDEESKKLMFTTNPFFYNLVNNIEDILYTDNLFFDIKSRGGFSLYILILSSILFVHKKEKKYLLASIPLLLWALLLSISIPRSLTRYIIIFIISWPILFLLALNKKRV